MLRSINFILVLSLVFTLTACGSRKVNIEDRPEHSSGTVQSSEAVRSDPVYKQHSLAHQIVLYLPNRIFDLMDIFRVRARLGPGVAVDARVSKYVQLYLGSYIAGFVGLPGPRRESRVPWPLGIESFNGLQLSVLDATANTCFDPAYSPSEIGLGVHFLLIGLDLGLDPTEIFDFLEGFFGGDFREDDL